MGIIYLNTLDGSIVNGNTSNLNAPSTDGLKLYQIIGENEAGRSVTQSVSVNVVGVGSINTFTSPNTVFTNTPFNLNWTTTNLSDLKISSTSGSGINTEINVTGNTQAVTPTSAGNYVYTLKGKNLADKETTGTRNVIVENDPTFTGFTVNGETSLTVSPSTTLSFVGTGYSSGATLQGRNTANTANVTLPSSASATAGTTTYYASATKTLNSVTKYSNLRSVVVTVVEGPTIGNITAPTTVFANAAFSSSWTGTNVSNYTIRGNVAASGVSTTDVDLNTTASRSITPTAAGTYTYTITATNSVGVETTKTFSVTVVADPTISAFSASPTTLTVGATTTFSWTSANNGTLSINQGVGTVTGTSKAYVTTTAGTIVYTLTNSRVLNSVTRSATRTVTLTVNSAKVCDWKTTAPVTMWTYVNGGMNPWQSSQYVYWNGTTVFSSTGNPVFQTSFTHGGYQYTLTQSPVTLCRQAI